MSEPLGPSARLAFADALLDTPVNAIPIGALRAGVAEAYGSPEAGVVVVFGEGTGFGDWREVLSILRSGIDCTRCLLPVDGADALGASLAGSVRFVEDVQYVLRGEPREFQSPAIRRCCPSDLPDHEREQLFGEVPAAVLDRSIVACAFVEERAIAQASSCFASSTFADIGVVTMAEFRDRGYATAAASFVARQVIGAGKMPVWSTALDNRSSRRVAEKLGFVEVSRQRVVVPETSGSQRWL